MDVLASTIILVLHIWFNGLSMWREAAGLFVFCGDLRGMRKGPSEQSESYI